MLKTKTKTEQRGFKVLYGVAKRLFGFLGEYRSRYIIGGLASSLEMASTMIMPYLYEQLVVVVESGGDSTAIYTIIALIFGLILITPLICWGVYTQQNAVAYATGELRKTLFRHIQKLPVSDTMEMKTGEYITLMTSDVERAGRALGGFAVTSLFRFVVLFTVSGMLLFARDWRMGLLSVVFSIVAFWASVKFTPPIRALDRQAQEYAADTASFLIETIRGMPVVRVFLLKKRFKERYRELCRGIQSRRFRYRAIAGLVDGLIYLFQYAAQPIAFLFGIYLVVREQMDIGTLVFLSGLVGVMAEATRSLSTFITFIQNGLVSAQRVFSVLDMPTEEERMTIAPPDFNSEIAVDIRNVSFSYPGGLPILKNFSLCIRRGEVIGIVGASGSGKTTLFKLLQDFYQVDSGEIELFGRSINDLSRTDVRALSSYIPQDNVLFDGTIADNIALGRPGSSRSDIEAVAKSAYLHDFIMTLPNGYDTIIGERGTQLSGGQRQRIAIARALLKDAPLLLLDEATSALDMESEVEVLKALGELMKNRTTIVIAHRLSTIQNADRIFVMDKGRIVESGDHNSLIKKAGYYARLYAN